MSKHSKMKEKNTFLRILSSQKGHVAFLAITFSNNFVRNMRKVKDRT